MPYVTPEIRSRLAEGRPPTNTGELTYVLTVAVDTYLAAIPSHGDRGGPSFQRLSEAVSALECAKLELYRRVLAPYEDGKIEINGDVYRLVVRGI